MGANLMTRPTGAAPQSKTRARQVTQSLLCQFMGTRGGTSLNGLLGQLARNGLQQQVRSWVSTQTNQPVSDQEIRVALGDRTLIDAARQAGVTPQEAAEELARVLPELIDNATPQGMLPDAQALYRAFCEVFETRA